MIDATITATGYYPSAAGIPFGGDFNLSLTGFDDASVNLERSTDGGKTWGIVETFTADAEQVGTGKGTPRYRFNCSAYTSGTIKARLS